MPQPILYLAITNHGFGHTTRMASVAAEIQRRCPEILLILVTTAPRWLLESYLLGDFILRPRALDIGVIQGDSLQMDKPATLEKLRHLRSHQSSLIAAEVNFIQQNRVGLILGDIPPLLAPIARAAQVPCWMIGNFGWDLIYRAWGREFEELADWIADCFAQTDRLFRLPLHEPMSAFPSITDVGFTGGTPRYAAEDLRTKLGLEIAIDQTILMTFGGLGLDQIPYGNLQRFPDWQFITFDRNAPELPNLLKLSGREYRPVDLMPLCDRILSKPGFSTFSEACRTHTPLVSITREDFAEAPLLTEGVKQYLPHQILSPGEFFESQWEWLHQPLQPPLQSLPEVADGNEAIAEAVLAWLNRG